MQSKKNQYFIDLLAHLHNKFQAPSNRKPLTRRQFSEQDSALLTQVEQLMQSRNDQSGIDKLTGLANRLGLKRQLMGMMPMSSGVLILLDIHRFRYVNDLFGFEFGDTLIKEFSERLLKIEAPADITARLDGDEFFLYFNQALSLTQVLALRQSLQQPFFINGTPIGLKLQLGYLTLPEHHHDVSVMLKRLDLALKEARGSRDKIAAYEAGMDQLQQRELRLIHDLPKSLTTHDCYLVYQPKWDIKNQCCNQVEALLRWNHPSLGYVSPAEFIPLAEYTGIIELVSEWALAEVIVQQQHWQQTGVNVQVAVNLSTRDLDNFSLSEDLLASLSRQGVSPRQIMIEITESNLMADIDKTLEVLHRLRAIGVQLAIDDFGTGYSSLAYLKHLPVDEVKIDKAFLDDILTDNQGAAILETSIQLAKRLGFAVTVEGVETQEIWDRLVQMGADKIQGQWFSSPLTAVELEQHWQELQTKMKSS
ncbi:bifunctional diguanylate cyclase/phosphodiesterase [Shewanella sp. NIFS-20-20]|uniref:putative bifunctional diguanylate cyclase/phosphodiesterase n=1 Tax=Shewanella sp. NIFS-20-20 TaxID=2853806 RepID=UPI001C45CF79|nr:bifunctional diguanylate cyclase/phosphodiesterase [Shewanella sp. NIFS-20-20]MBV7314963.1 bifunctional diguanylate cyclase/phosphodiesterase [Shewanella sp. NIFS-20-20]